MGPLSAADADSYAPARTALVAAIESDVRETADYLGRDRLDERVPEALRTVPRHAFVPMLERPFAYENRPLPIGHGQTISQPYIVAIMTDLLDPQPGDLVFELGTGSLVRRMLERFRAVIGPQLGRIAERGLTVRQEVTLASIVELETAHVAERPRIAAVFWNRLDWRMPLQTDPSINYALKQAGRWDGNIRKRDLEIDSPYNTYRRRGLPPGPLGSPGKEAILAVLEPALTRELYFVSRNDGTHEFSETLAAHNRAVNRFQRRRVSS